MHCASTWLCVKGGGSYAPAPAALPSNAKTHLATGICSNLQHPPQVIHILCCLPLHYRRPSQLKKVSNGSLNCAECLRTLDEVMGAVLLILHTRGLRALIKFGCSNTVQLHPKCRKLAPETSPAERKGISFPVSLPPFSLPLFPPVHANRLYPSLQHLKPSVSHPSETRFEHKYVASAPAALLLLIIIV